METVKISMVAGGRGTRMMSKWKTEFLGQWKYAVYYNDEYVPLYICQNPHNVQ